MPELPEVETIAAALREHLIGLRITHVRIARRDFVRHGGNAIRRLLANRRIDAIERHGKRMWLIIDGGAACLLHLGMSGRITVESVGAPTLPHTHLALRFDNHTEMRFRDPRRFGGVWLFEAGRAQGESALAPLGPDALTIATPVFSKLCRGRRPIKALLLDQRALAGVGNIYADEALFDAHIHPLTMAGELSIETRRKLATSLRRVLRRAVRMGGSTLRDYVRADGTMGEFQNVHRVYGRTDEPCPRCRAPVERLVVAQRSTHICPICQKGIASSS